MPVIQLWEAEVGISFELRILSHIERLCQTKNILAMDQNTWSTWIHNVWNSTKGHQAYKDIWPIVGWGESVRINSK